MKIIRLTTLLDFGGIESKMANLSSYEDLNNEWIFCAIGKGGSAEKKIRKNNKEVVCFNLPFKIPSVVSVVKLFFYFRKHKPDVVHASGAEANFHGFIAAKLANVPVIITEEIGIPQHSRMAVVIFKRIFRFSDFVLGESKIVIENLKRKYNINEDKLKVISNFALFSKNEMTNISFKKNEFRLLSVSRLEPVKNIEGIIRAVYRLKQENFEIKYTIVGDGSSRELFIDLIKELGLENEIILAGFQSSPQRFFAETDLYILNSFSEGFSNSLLEAMYMEKPSVTTNVGAAEEIIEEGVNGWVVDVGNEIDLFQRLKLIIGMDSKMRTRVGVKARETVICKYSLEVHVNSLLRLYKSKL